MIKIRKLICVLMTVLVCIGICISISACGDKESRYDAAIRVRCSDGGIYEFPVGVDVRHIKIQYDSIERTFEVVQYNLPKRDNIWVSPNPSPYAIKEFNVDILYGTEDTGFRETENVFAYGEYCVRIESNYTSTIMNYRVCRLYITLE